MDICYVCGNILSENKICSVCGFDASADAENYPALQLAPGLTSIAEQQNRRIQTIVKSVVDYRHESQEKLIKSLFEEAFKKFAEAEKQQIKTTVEQAVREQGEKFMQQLREHPTAPAAAQNTYFKESPNQSAKAPKNEQTKPGDAPVNTAADHLSPNVKPIPQPQINIGNKIKIGNYAGILEWEVLDIKDGNALVICSDLIDVQSYNGTTSNTSWEKCFLRQWLNGIFYQNAFSAEEKKNILFKTIPAHHNPQRPWVDPGADTKDNIFLLSYVEVDKYPQIKKLPNENTIRANHVGKWWLRTPGWNTSLACYVNESGDVVVWEANANITNKYGVRPAMWVKLTK